MNTILLNENKILSAQNKKLKKLLNMYKLKYKEINLDEENEIVNDIDTKTEDNNKQLLIEIADELNKEISNTFEENPKVDDFNINETIELCIDKCLEIEPKNDNMEIEFKQTKTLLCIDYDKMIDDSDILNENICKRCKCDYVYCKCNKHNEILYY